MIESVVVVYSSYNMLLNNEYKKRLDMHEVIPYTSGVTG